MLFRPAAQINAGLIGQAKVLLFRCPKKAVSHSRNEKAACNLQKPPLENKSRGGFLQDARGRSRLPLGQI